MVQKSLRALLALGLLLPLFAQGSRRRSCQPKKRCQDYTSLIANCLTVRCNANLNNLTVGGSITTSGGLLSGVVPFSSGLVPVTTLTPILPGSIVMAFGSNSPTGVVPTISGTAAGDNVIKNGYSFTVPRAGTLHDLRVSVDAVYTSTLSTPITFTFIVEKAPCINGAVSSFASTGLTATASPTNPGAAGLLPLLIPSNTACGFNPGSVAVQAGDRVTIRVTPDATIPATLLTFATFSAGVLYSPF